MATFQALIDEVLSHQFSPAQYTTYLRGESGVFPGIINEAQAYVTSQTDFRELLDSEDMTTTSGTAAYTLPTDYQRVYTAFTVAADGTNTPLTQISPSGYDDRGTASSGTPSHYTIDGSSVKLWPIPDNAYTVRLRYFRAPQTMTSVNASPEIPGRYHHLLVSYALWHCYERENDYNAAAYHKGRFDEDIMKCRGEVQYDIDDYSQPKQLGDGRTDMLAPNAPYF